VKELIKGLINWRMNEWKDEWMNKWMKERMNEEWMEPVYSSKQPSPSRLLEFALKTTFQDRTQQEGRPPPVNLN